MAWCSRPARSLFAVILALAIVGCAANDDATTRAASPASSSGQSSAGSAGSATVSTLPSGDDAIVGSIVDGDTLRTKDGERIRLLNIDTPEPTQNECWSSEATTRLRDLVPPGTPIRLQYDRERLDRYGRTLAHVYRQSDELWVNLQLVIDGAARAYVLAPNDALYPPIERAAAEAERNGVGLWGACERSGVQQPQSTRAGGATATTIAAPSGDGRAGCDPSYPTVCIPPPPPDLDCSDIPYRRFPVLPPDPHHFDGGGDGIGCERG